MGLEIFPAEGEQWNCNQCFSACCIVILHKGAIIEVILVYELNAREFFHGDAKFSREFGMGMPNSLGDFAWGCRILCSVGDTKNTEGVPKSLGDLTRGCQILGGVPDPL